MHRIAEIELDATRVYEAEISVIPELGPVPGDGTETSAALAARVDAAQLRQYGQQLAANWELLARFLEYLKPRGLRYSRARGWRFKGTSGDGVAAYAIISTRHGKPGELHAALSVLPTDLRDWLSNEGGLLINRPEPAPILWHSIEVRMTPTGWKRFDAEAGWG
jgi:hypothetical protein